MNSKLDVGLFDSLRKVSQLIRIILWDISKETDLSPMQVQIVHYMSGKSNKNSSVTELAQEFDLKKATITESINNLVKKGVISKERSSHDRRKINLQLTENVENILESIYSNKSKFLHNIREIDNNSKQQAQEFLIEFLLKFNDKTMQRIEICPTCKDYEEITDLEDMFFCRKRNSRIPKTEIQWNCGGYR